MSPSAARSIVAPSAVLSVNSLAGLFTDTTWPVTWWGRARELGVFAGAVPTAGGRTSSAQDAPVRTIVAKVAETTPLTHFRVVIAVPPWSNLPGSPFRGLRSGWSSIRNATTGMPRRHRQREGSGGFSGIRVGRTYSVALSQRRRFFASDGRERADGNPKCRTTPTHVHLGSRALVPRRTPAAMLRNGDWPRPDE